MLPFDVVSGRFRANAPTQLRCYLKFESKIHLLPIMTYMYMCCPEHTASTQTHAGTDGLPIQVKLKFTGFSEIRSDGP